jgi:hypothetical protein
MIAVFIVDEFGRKTFGSGLSQEKLSYGDKSTQGYRESKCHENHVQPSDSFRSFHSRSYGNNDNRHPSLTKEIAKSW